MNIFSTEIAGAPGSPTGVMAEAAGCQMRRDQGSWGIQVEILRENRDKGYLRLSLLGVVENPQGW